MICSSLNLLFFTVPFLPRLLIAPEISSLEWLNSVGQGHLNNILEQDHRAIKHRVNAKQGFREFHAARRTIQGYEAIHMMRKGQVRWVKGNDVGRQIRFIEKLFGLVA